MIGVRKTSRRRLNTSKCRCQEEDMIFTARLQGFLVGVVKDEWKEDGQDDC